MMKKLPGHKAAVTNVACREVAAEEVNTDAEAYTRLGWWIVIAGMGGFILWASLAPLDQGVPVSGTVTVATNKKVIQHPTGGVVEEILVKEGDVVKAGQPLVKMNDIQAKAQADIARVQYFAARATEARLIAERDGRKSVEFPPELENEKSNPRVAADIRTQKQLFDSRRSAILSELAILEEQLGGMRDLAREGFVARNRLLDLKRTYVQRRQGYQNEVRSQLADVQKEAESLKMRLTSLDFDLANAIVKAPVDGTVVGMNVFTNGGVISPGFRMMDIVPSEDQLVVEGMVPVNLIDKVYPELSVELIFVAFNQKPHVPGVVIFVSADRMVDERSGTPYYKMKAAVTPAGMKLIGHLQVRPGMPVELFIKTGERTMMNYLLRPVVNHMRTSFSEE
ncbi:MAG: HlyD family efflux transporter periplasmic adaptor subunit [Gallionella sp.]|nr:HlyD family efflux transporter periplasmic adaptor subunit [Gallionella sp.]